MEIQKYRRVKSIVTGDTQHDGAGVKLVRVLGRPTVYDFDPFLMLDAFDSLNPDDYTKGFPWHPHRGIETVTYLISGKIEHGDSLGNKGVITDGDCQWMTAGNGIIHQEMPKPSERMLGVQLWLNLPKKDKMTEPKYNDITSEIIPTVEEENSIIKVLSGNYKGINGAMKADYVDMQFLDVKLAADSTWSMETDNDKTLFIYIVEGSAFFEEEKIDSKRAVLFEAGEKFVVRSSNQGIRLLLFAAKPLKEPIAWGGPIVMNTDDELKQAFAEIDQGTFINHAKTEQQKKGNDVHEEYYKG
ncbi:pirin family protein [Desulfuribacillus alkaliarsenatis]|uniref:Pirin n=1 Tax=Desulfuribacillus alkaliarsenatis TaxID=766136 RepID=A0A1E5G114_9FIRM|nr:pirin family protein [Desulfuribacillus alkaliarsenatis]OEF96602.1 hypothetical protein BHF68_08130 [Desulfuribacillus alkaliarsenatis]